MNNQKVANKKHNNNKKQTHHLPQINKPSAGYSQVIQLLDGKTNSKQLKFVNVSHRKTTEM